MTNMQRALHPPVRVAEVLYRGKFGLTRPFYSRLNKGNQAWKHSR